MHGACILHKARKVGNGSEYADSKTRRQREYKDDHYADNQPRRYAGCRTEATHELERSTLRLLLTTKLEAEQRLLELS